VTPTFHVAAVVVRDGEGRILVVRKTGTSKFMLPGGKIESGETAAKAAVREIHEELGIQLDHHALVDLGTFTAPAANEPDHLVQGRVFEHPWVPDAHASGEIAEIAWLEPDDAASRSDLAPMLRDHVLPALQDGELGARIHGVPPASVASLGVVSEPVPADRPGIPAAGDDPAAAVLRMRASDADRDKVAGVLRDAYAEGRLSPAEHQERLAEVYAAQTYGDLVPTLRDLPVPPGTLAVPGHSGLTLSTPAVRTPDGLELPPVYRDLAGSAEGSPVAIFSGFERRGDWVVPAALNATCVFGGGEIDFTEARLTAAETVITVVCLFGGLEITVPDGMGVRGEVIGVFGGSDMPKGGAPAGAPVLVVKGAAIFGGVSVKRASERKGRRRG
jgi:8-oxo-dGTP pyrophosphatase MutT (NUDIX family)